MILQRKWDGGSGVIRMSRDIIADALSSITNAEMRSKKEIVITPVSKLLRNVIEIMKKEGYISDYEFVENNKGNAIILRLKGAINKCGVIKPRFSVKFEEWEKWEKRYLPAKDFGILIVSTPQGVMTHQEAKRKNLGGVLIAYVY